MSVTLPHDVILLVDSVEVRLDPGQHPFERDNAAEIAANWQAESAANPALFDGQVVLLSNLAYRDGHLAGRCHAVRYSTFLYWRHNRAGSGAGHVFAHAMLVSADNALVAIRMAGHTVNAGRVYFAAGSFEPSDFPGGEVDLHLNMSREVREETGLDIDGVRRGARYHALSMNQGTVIFRRYFLAMDAAEIADRIDRFAASEAVSEIDGAVIIRGASQLPEGLMPHMQPIIAWHFANGGDV